MPFELLGPANCLALGEVSETSQISLPDRRTPAATRLREHPDPTRHPSGDWLRITDVPTRRQLLCTAGLGGVAAAVGLSGCGTTPAPAGSNDTPGSATRITYGSDPSQFGELSVPTNPAQATLPVVVILHGGFWSSTYGQELGRPLAADLIRSGVAVWNVEYRRIGAGEGGGGGWPATGLDVAAALEALAGPVQQAAHGRLDLQRVVAVGHSAGGQLAGWLAARPRARDGVGLRGVVAQAGVMDLKAAAAVQLGGGAVQTFLGGSPQQQPAAYAQASPTARAPLPVPVVCVHGRSDVTVPPSQSMSFVAADTAAGGSASLRMVEGDHFAMLDPGSAAWSTCRAETLRLLG